MAKKAIGVRIEDSVLTQLKEIINKNPRLDLSLLINISLVNLVKMDEESLNKTIFEYFISDQTIAK